LPTPCSTPCAPNRAEEQLINQFALLNPLLNPLLLAWSSWLLATQGPDTNKSLGIRIMGKRVKNLNQGDETEREKQGQGSLSLQGLPSLAQNLPLAATGEVKKRKISKRKKGTPPNDV
jgi:hypothetical protein